MTHLKIEQNTSYTENVSLAIIEALYNIAKSGQLDNESDLLGTVRGYCYDDAKLYLEAHYPNFHINVIDNEPYIRFEDPNMATYLGYIGIGSNGLITKAQAAAATSVATNQTTFDNVNYKTLVTKFNEFKYFTGIILSLGGWNGGSSGALRFSGWTALEEVDISNIECLGHRGDYGHEDTFAECTNLKTVTASSKLKKIGCRAFRNCSNLEDITGLTGTIMIACDAFINCAKLKPSNFTNVTFTYDNISAKFKKSAFYGCSLLTSLTFTDVTELAEGTCNGCTSLSSVSGISNVTIFGNLAFKGCTNLPLTQNDIQSATSIGGEAFYNTKLSGNISLSLTSLGNSVFYNTLITSIDLTGSTITELYKQCFRGCPNLTSVSFPLSITKIGDHCFRECTNLTTIGDLQNITSIGEGAFYGASSIQELNFPSLTTIVSNNYGHNFNGCSSLVKVTFGHLLQLTTGSGSSTSSRAAFGNCSSLKIVDFGDSITRINPYNFYGCSNLEAVIIRNTDTTNLPTLGTYTSNGDIPLDMLTLDMWFGNNTVNIYVPDSVLNDYKTAPGFSLFESNIKSLNDYNETTILNS